MDKQEIKDEDDLIHKAKEIFEAAVDEESENRLTFIADMEFSRGLNQWPQEIREKREREGRPCLTIDKTQSFIRQVVNDARQNKPAIKVHPVDSNADPETADVQSGLIRNIERSSKADLAYDTGVENAAGGGWGYIRVNIDYETDNSFDYDIKIDRVVNPLSIYGDPDSTSADGSDWNNAFVIERLTKDQWERRYDGKSKIGWEHAEWGMDKHWRNEDGVLVAEWWHREEVDEEIYKISDGNQSVVVSQTQMDEDEDVITALNSGMFQVVNRRTAKRFKVTQYIMTSAEILEVNEWPGKWIPIIPIYGDEFFIEERRYLRSLIHPVKDAQAMFNFWRTNGTELVALAPRTPWVGPKGFEKADPHGWATANTESHAYLRYSGNVAPTRQPIGGEIAAGSIQEALNASDDMKAIIGMYDASLGARSNETSGRAIMARQREGDTATFHFTDNLTRAIRQVGNILLDLIPHVYNEERIVRVLGEDGTGQDVKVNAPFEKVNPETGEPETDDNGDPILALHNLTSGKYDLTVNAGPSYTTRREEAAYQMTEAIRSYPDFAPLILDKLAKVMDWPDSDEIAERAKRMVVSEDSIPPQIQEALEQAQALAQELEALKADKSIASEEVKIKAYEAETKRIQATNNQSVDRIKLAIDLAEKADRQDIDDLNRSVNPTQ